MGCPAPSTRCWSSSLSSASSSGGSEDPAIPRELQIRDLNDHEQSAGDFDVCAFFDCTVLWNANSDTDLSDQLASSPHWHREDLHAITASGQIVGLARAPSGFREAFLSTPSSSTTQPPASAVPLLAPVALMLGAIGSRGLIRRRRPVRGREASHPRRRPAISRGWVGGGRWRAGEGSHPRGAGHRRATAIPPAGDPS